MPSLTAPVLGLKKRGGACADVNPRHSLPRARVAPKARRAARGLAGAQRLGGALRAAWRRAGVQLRWLKVGYVKKLAQRDGPFPRQQDLNPAGVHVGMPPGRKFSLSHGWSSEMHPCPNGAKLKRLAAKLEELGEDDVHDVLATLKGGRR